MGRPNKPWFKARADAWVVKVRGKQHTLAKGRKNKAQAMRAFHELMGKLGRVEVPADDLPAWALCDQYLDHVAATTSAYNLKNHRQYLKSFVAAVGRGRPASSVREHEAAAWLASEHEWTRRGGKVARATWNPTTRAAAARSVKACYRWGLRTGKIPSNPLADLAAPTPLSSDAYATRAELEALIAASGPAFAAVASFMMETGCRPSEAAKIEASHARLDAGVVEFSGKTTKRTGRDRVIYLTDKAAAILRANWREDGPIFRGPGGGPWNCNTLYQQALAARRKAGLGPHVTPKSFRHGLITDAVASGMPERLVAALAGHTSTVMINRHYLHLAKKQEEMRAAAERAARRGKGED